MRNFEFLSPGAFWLGLGALCIIATYILKFQRQRRVVRSLVLVKPALRDAMASTPFQRLRARLPLILQLLALACVVVGAARPARSGTASGPGAVVLIFDVSASMAAREPSAADATRLELAGRRARQLLATITPGTPLMMVQTARGWQTSSPVRLTATELEADLAGLRVQQTDGALSEGVALADDALRSMGGDGGELWIFTDGASIGARELPSTTHAARVYSVGTKAANAGIIAAELGTNAAGDSADLWVLVSNGGDTQVAANVTVLPEAAGSVPIARGSAVIEPHGRAQVLLSVPRSQTESGVRVHLEHADALDADNDAVLPSAQAEPLQVVLATARSASHLERVLRTAEGMDVRILSEAQLTRSPAPADAMLVTEGFCPAAVQARAWLAVDAGLAPCAALPPSVADDQPSIVSWSHQDARMRYLSMVGVHVSRANVFQTDGRHALVQTARGALVADASVLGREVTAVGFALEDSDWPQRASFVVFIRNLLENFRAASASGGSASVRTGTLARISVPPNITQLQITRPGRPAANHAARDGVALIDDLTQIGFLDARWDTPSGAGNTRVAVNLMSAAETNIAPQTISPGALEPTAKSHAPELARRRDLGALLAWFALLVIAAEVWLATQRSSARRASGAKLTTTQQAERAS